MKTTLLIKADGIGSRFGTGIKQLEPVDSQGALSDMVLNKVKENANLMPI